MVSFARTSTFAIAYASASVVPDPAVAGTFCSFSTGLKMPWTAPGTPYSYGPPTTVGTRSKLKTGGGEDTCHSSVSARHGLAVALGPPRQLHTMLYRKIRDESPSRNELMLIIRFQPAKRSA